MIAAIIQARMSSRRLPGKVLKPILGIPMLGRQIERVRRARALDEIVVATSTQDSDQNLVDFCHSIDVRCVRGSLDDVLGRYRLAAQSVDAHVIVRLTGDCPLSDPNTIDALIGKYAEGGFDYVSNTLKPTFPDGLDTEVFSRHALETAYHNATLLSEREHVTPYLKTSDDISKYNFENDLDLSGLRWTVDEPADFELVHKIFAALYSRVPDFAMTDVLALLEQHPDWANLNKYIERDAGYAKSLLEDEQLRHAKSLDKNQP